MHGVNAVRPLNSDFAAFFEALDALEQRLAFMNCAGRILFATGAMQQLLEKVPDLAAQLASFSIEICERSVHGRWPSITQRLALREISLAGEVMLITGSHIAFDFLGSGPTVLLSVETVRQDLLDPERLRRRFKLTRQECKVARLLGLGLSNEQIATELSISAHTARHHMQRIVQKLNASSRAALVSMLLRPDESKE